MKIRKHEWLNTRDLKVMYGIQGRIEPRGRWVNLCEADRPCIYETEPERDAKMREIRTGKHTANAESEVRSE